MAHRGPLASAPILSGVNANAPTQLQQALVDVVAVMSVEVGKFRALAAASATLPLSDAHARVLGTYAQTLSKLVQLEIEAAKLANREHQVDTAIAAEARALVKQALARNN